MTLSREVSLQTWAVLDQTETNINRLMGSDHPNHVAVAFGFLMAVAGQQRNVQQAAPLGVSELKPTVAQRTSWGQLVFIDSKSKPSKNPAIADGAK